jgi:transglutaminase-like putative cysteine protease
VDEQRTASLAPGALADPFLRSTRIVDWTTLEVLRLALSLSDDSSDQVEIARRCFEWVRDKIEHTVDYGRDEVTSRASDVLRVGTGFCYAKSHLLVALLRANGIRAGFAYQRLALSDEGHAFCLHGLAAIDVAGHGWYRVDPRGNKPGVEAQFTPPAERLAFPCSKTGELIFPRIYSEPVPAVARALESYRSASILSTCLPDALTEYELEH